MAMEYREGELQDLRAMRDRLHISIGWFEGANDNGGTVVATTDVVRSLRWVLNGKPETYPAAARK